MKSRIATLRIKNFNTLSIRHGTPCSCDLFKTNQVGWGNNDSTELVAFLSAEFNSWYF